MSPTYCQCRGLKLTKPSHTPWSGAASIEEGVTLDLSGLDGAILNADQTIVTLGPGARWANVYTTLIPNGLATSGGRVAQVGVGGLTTGGKCHILY